MEDKFMAKKQKGIIGSVVTLIVMTFMLVGCGDTTTSPQPRIDKGLEYTANITDELLRFPTANQGREVPFYNATVSSVDRIREGLLFFDRVGIGSFDFDGANVMVFLNGPFNVDIGFRKGDVIDVSGTFQTVNRNPIGFLNEYALMFEIIEIIDDH